MSHKYPTAEELNAERARRDAESMAKYPVGYYWVYLINSKGMRGDAPMVAKRSEYAWWYVPEVDDCALDDEEVEVISERLVPPC